jgi:hypothetical protein
MTIQKKDIEKLVVENKKSTLKNHWIDSFNFNSTNYSGEIRKNEILLWKSSHFLRGAYPIYHLSFDENNELNGIKMEKNPYHIFLDKTFIAFFIVIVFAISFTNNFRDAIIGNILIFVFGFLLYLFMSKVIKYETKNLTDELRETIENIELLNNPELIKKSKPELENEWTFSKIITRLLVYPFCLFVICSCFYFFLLEGKVIKGIFGIAVAVAYPISDILLIIRKRKNYS